MLVNSVESVKFYLVTWRFFRLFIFSISDHIIILSLFSPFKGILYIGYFWNVIFIYSFHKYLLTVGCQLDIVGFIGVNTVPALRNLL